MQLAWLSMPISHIMSTQDAALLCQLFDDDAVPSRYRWRFSQRVWQSTDCTANQTETEHAHGTAALDRSNVFEARRPMALRRAAVVALVSAYGRHVLDNPDLARLKVVIQGGFDLA
jgi:hypothetical protein